MTAQGIYYLIRAAVTLVAIPFHEAGHALAAWLLGDDTAKREGRLSLNPFRHFDLLGTLCMIVAGVGWAKPVSTDPRNFKNPKAGMALTALAARWQTCCWRIWAWWVEAPLLLGSRHPAAYLAARFCQYLVYMDIGLAVFNLIPVPPLDGSRILLAVLPPRLYFGVMRYEKAILIVLLAAVWSGFLDAPLGVMNDVMWDLLDLGTGYIDKIALSAYYASVGTVI